MEYGSVVGEHEFVRKNEKSVQSEWNDMTTWDWLIQLKWIMYMYQVHTILHES